MRYLWETFKELFYCDSINMTIYLHYITPQFTLQQKITKTMAKLKKIFSDIA